MAKTSFSNILDIPGLVPIDLHSSSQFPVPFAPRITPPRAATLAPAVPSGPGPAPETGGGAVDPYSNMSLMGGGTGDALSLGLSGGAGGYSPDFWTQFYGGGDISPAQLSTFGNIGLGGFSNFGQNLWDRIGSITDTPYVSNDNIAQAGINAAGMFIPGITPLAGILQGFNLLDPGETTGNPLADLAMTPGGTQSLFADAANWINRQFGGEYMPSSYIDPNATGPSGSGYFGNPTNQLEPMGNGWNTPAPTTDYGSGVQDFSNAMIDGTGMYDTSGGGYTPPPISDYYGLGGQAYDIGGAGIFNSIGLSPWQTGDMGGAIGFGGGGGGWNPWDLPNGGWGQ